MKKIMLGVVLMLSIVKYDPVDGQVSDNVLKSFSQQYPQGSIRKWVVKNDTCVAEFTMSRSKNMAYYLADGNWIKTETKIPWTKDLPKAVNLSWKYSDFASWYVAGIKEVKYPDKDLYVLKVQHDCGPEGSIPGDCLNIYKLYFDPDGSLIKKVHMGDNLKGSYTNGFFKKCCP